MITQPTNEDLQRFEAHARAANEALHQAFVAAFPVGTQVTWLYRENHIQTGVVEFSGHISSYHSHPQMRVRNDRTGRLVWVDLSMQPQISVYNEVQS